MNPKILAIKEVGAFDSIGTRIQFPGANPKNLKSNSVSALDAASSGILNFFGNISQNPPANKTIPKAYNIALRNNDGSN